MKHWNLSDVPPSTEKAQPRQAGADAPRKPTDGPSKPRVLFAYPECRAVVIDLPDGATMGDHSVRERAVVQVLSGSVEFMCNADLVTCKAGDLVVFEPSEHHSVTAIHAARLLLLLPKWNESMHPNAADHGPRNATVS